MKILTFLGAALMAVSLSACSAAAPDPGQPCAPVQVTGPDGNQLDLSGTWSGNDGGLYYIKQIESCVWWSGVSNFDGQFPGEEWIMTFKGAINSDGLIVGDFVDVKSTNPGSGTMTIEARVDQVEGRGAVVNLYRTASTGGQIGVTFWERYTEPEAEPEPEPTDPTPDPGQPTDAPTDTPPESPAAT